MNNTSTHVEGEYKVVMYMDHVQFGAPFYFNNYEHALACWRDKVLSQALNARYTAGAALIRTSTGEPLHRQTWRVG